MKTAERMLKTLLLGFMQSPWATMRSIAGRFSPERGDREQLLRLRQATRQAPLVLQVETTNVCNAACVFCAYPVMQREKGVMTMALFERVIGDYAAMGGGTISLTPVVGDPLLDPQLMERLRMLQAEPMVRQVTMTTNAIALDRYDDDEVCRLLEALDCIQVSIGGLDAERYRVLYGVDRLPKVLDAVERLLHLREAVAGPSQITLAFRTSDWAFELRHKRQLAAYRQRGVFISHIWSYANYAGVVKSGGVGNLHVLESSPAKQATCVYPCVHLAVCWDGRVTACGCADFEGKSLWLGTLGEASLAELWGGDKRAAILASFGAGRLTPICRQCTAYQGDSIFGQAFCRDVAPHQPLPLAYFQQFWGG